MAAPVIDTHGVTEETAGLTDPYDISITVPTHSSGDLLVAFIMDENGRDIDSVPSGWALIDSNTTGTAGQARIWAYWKVAGGSEPGSYAWSLNGSSNGRQLGMLVISGAADPAGNAIESADSFDAGSGGSTSSPAVTPSDADSLVCRLVASPRNTAYTVPSGETLQFSNTGTTTALAVSYFTHGTTSTGTNNWPYTPTWHVAHAHITFALAPTGGGGSSIAAIANHYRRLRTR